MIWWNLHHASLNVKIYLKKSILNICWLIINTITVFLNVSQEVENVSGIVFWYKLWWEYHVWSLFIAEELKFFLFWLNLSIKYLKNLMCKTTEWWDKNVIYTMVFHLSLLCHTTMNRDYAGNVIITFYVPVPNAVCTM